MPHYMLYFNLRFLRLNKTNWIGIGVYGGQDLGNENVCSIYTHHQSRKKFSKFSLKIGYTNSIYVVLIRD